jgi:tetratricopeptide (TPR) repeat protein
MRSWMLVCVIAVGCAPTARVVSSPPATSAPPAASAPPRSDGAPAAPRVVVLRLQAAVAERPDDVQSWGALSSALRGVNRLPEALRAAWRAVELKPDFAAWGNLGSVLMQGEAVRGAWAAFEKAAESAPAGTAAQNFLNLGYRQWIQGNDENAQRAYDRATRLTPDNPLALYDLAFLLSSQRKVPQAAEAAQRCLRAFEHMPAISAAAREEVEIMKAFLGKIVAGERMQRPPPIEGGQVLPERLWRDQPAPGKALSLPIPPQGRRIYGVNRTLIGFIVPSSYNEALSVQELTTVGWTPSDAGPPRWKILVSFAPLADAFDVRAAAEGAMRQLNKGKPDLPMTRAELPAGEAYWFWIEDPRYDANKPGDFRFAAQLFGRTGTLGLTATLLTNDPSGADRERLLEILKSAETHQLIE